jgi:hypothetical protein
MLHLSPQSTFTLGTPFPIQIHIRSAYVQRELYAGESFAKGSSARSKSQPRFPFVGYAAENPQGAENGKVNMDTLPDSSEPPEG